MLYQRVIEILDMSRDEKTDIGIALIKCVNEAHLGTFKDYAEAKKFLKINYPTITKCRRLGKNEYIKELCEIYASGDKEAFEEKVCRINKIEE